MQQSDVPEAFARILADTTKVDRAAVARDKRLREDLGINSLSLIDVAVATEDTFGITIPDEELERFQTVGDVVDHIQRLRIAV